MLRAMRRTLSKRHSGVTARGREVGKFAGPPTVAIPYFLCLVRCSLLLLSLLILDGAWSTPLLSLLGLI
jgi:hypothetical protein